MASSADRNEEVFLYQTLVGVDIQREHTPSIVERPAGIRSVKATRDGHGLNTRWTLLIPRTKALKLFVHRVLKPEAG